VTDPRVARFHWAVGIEDTSIGVPLRHSGRTLDEYQLTEHDRRFREDLDLAASLGIDAIRYGVPWYSVNPAPGIFEWGWLDDAIDHAAGVRGLTVIADLVHYGVPGWLAGGFIDPAYPQAVAEYAAAFAERYGRIVNHYTPLNEPTITAAFCGEFGGWPPYLTGPEGWVRIALAIADGIQRSIAAIRAADPHATIVHVEAAKVVRPGVDGLAAPSRLAEQRAFLPTDLVLGGVGSDHQLASWLLQHGADEQLLTDLGHRAATIDIMGVNFYPDFSVREIVRLDGANVEVAGGGGAEDLVAALGAFHEKYGRPVFIAETSTDGTDAQRVAWLAQSVAAVRAAAADGLPVWGYTWWPMLDFVDWGYSAGDHPLEDFRVRVVDPNGTTRIAPLPSLGVGASPADGVSPWLRRMGLWRLEYGHSGLERIPTPAADSYRRLVASARPDGSEDPHVAWRCRTARTST